MEIKTNTGRKKEVVRETERGCYINKLLQFGVENMHHLAVLQFKTSSILDNTFRENKLLKFELFLKPQT